MRVKTTPLIVEPLATRSVALDQIALSVVQAGAAPAASCAAGFRAKNGWKFGVGAAGTMWPNSPSPATPDTCFDLASLTKAITAVAATAELTARRMDRETAVEDYLPELRGTSGAYATLEQLLSHRAGFVPHVELFRRWRSGMASDLTRLLMLAANSIAGCTENERDEVAALYSDLGYILAGLAIERSFSKSLDVWLGERLPGRVGSNLGSARQWLKRDPDFRRRCAPTEVVPWRGGLVCGRVHDENAWLVRGHGLCGHAGLFGTAIGVAGFGAAVLSALAGESTWIPQAAARLATDRRQGGTLCCGFDRKSASASSAGSLASDEAFGHLGFTGTSVWCDPRRPAVAVLLTNRVCPSRQNVKLRSLRPVLHDALFAWSDRESTG